MPCYEAKELEYGGKSRSWNANVVKEALERMTVGREDWKGSLEIQKIQDWERLISVSTFPERDEKCYCFY